MRTPDVIVRNGVFNEERSANLRSHQSERESVFNHATRFPFSREEYKLR